MHFQKNMWFPYATSKYLHSFKFQLASTSLICMWVKHSMQILNSDTHQEIYTGDHTVMLMLADQ